MGWDSNTQSSCCMQGGRRDADSEHGQEACWCCASSWDWAYFAVTFKVLVSLPGRSNIALRKITSQMPGGHVPQACVPRRGPQSNRGAAVEAELDVVHGKNVHVLAHEGVFGLGQDASQGVPLEGLRAVSTGNRPINSGINPKARRSEGPRKPALQSPPPSCPGWRSQWCSDATCGRRFSPFLQTPRRTRTRCSRCSR